MSYRFAGAPEPDAAAAIVACIEMMLSQAEPPPAARVPAWRRAAIRENLTHLRAARPGVIWRTAIAGP